MPITEQTNDLTNSPLATTVSASIYLPHTNKRNNHIQTQVNMLILRIMVQIQRHIVKNI